MRVLVLLAGLLAAFAPLAFAFHHPLHSFFFDASTHPGEVSSARHDTNPVLSRPDSSSSARNHTEALTYRASMVHNNPGEGLTQTRYANATVIRNLGFNVMVKNDGRPPHTAITWDSFDPDIFPKGSEERKWVDGRAREIDVEIEEMKKEGLMVAYWSDVFVLPRRLVERYGRDIVDEEGRWSFESEIMVNITRYMFDAVFVRFPDLDGLVIRTGEIYTNDVPHHVGASPITEGWKSHVQLLKILQEVVIEKHGKTVFCRTWGFDGFHEQPEYYMKVDEAIEPNDKLVMVIKHTKGDFWRTLPFNPTLGIGRHQFMVEVQCQREYEGKGATPNYVMKGVIEGFDENIHDESPKSLSDLVGNPLFKGVLAWPRGGGWHGPYPADEFWIDMNVEVLARWAQGPSEREEDLFVDWVRHGLGLDYESARNLREIALLSARGTLLGHYSLSHQMINLPWTRDWYIGGADAALRADFEAIIEKGLVDDVLSEKALAVYLWEMLPGPAHNFRSPDKKLRDFIDHSIQYGILLYTIIWRSWIVQLKGMQGDKTGEYDVDAIRIGIEAYDLAMDKYMALSGEANSTGTVSSLYTPFQYRYTDPDPVLGANHSVNMWRWVIGEGEKPEQLLREEL